MSKARDLSRRHDISLTPVTKTSLGLGNVENYSRADIREARANLHASNFVGVISGFAQSGAPTGWLICDGATLNGDGTAYENLWNAIGTTYGGSGQSSFILPDLRGEFLRCSDQGRGVDSGRAHASTQGDTTKSSWYGYNNFQSHYHTGGWGSGYKNWQIKHSGYPDNYGPAETTNAFVAPWYQIGQGIGYNNMRLQVGDAGETKPRNLAVQFCIKY